MKIFLHNIQLRFLFLKRSIQKNREMFFFTPERYWRAAVGIFVILLLAILCLDAILFWQFGLAPAETSQETKDMHLVLERGLLEETLSLLRNREARFQQKTGTTTVRNIFAAPTAPQKK